MIHNPFIKDAPVVLRRKIPKNFLINRYKEELNINVENILATCASIDIYECQKSGYKFYYPFNITGDSNFYELLQEYDWYYLPWKWEHQTFKSFIKEGDKILEVGCGQGAFIENISSQFNNVQCVGLELNESAVVLEEKFKVINSTIENYCIENEGAFDIVCSFQVLEHIQDVSSFLEANISCLKVNGLLAICVPNNDSFIKFNQNDILNMPPHHMGLWTESSLNKIGEYYKLDFVKVFFEPLQEYHFDYYTDLSLKKFFGTYLAKVFIKALNLFKMRSIVRTFLKSRAEKIKGHSILIIFRKSI